jgi:hypothetical protein
LISDVVTGKLDVCDAAARLPDEPDEDQVDDADMVTDPDDEAPDDNDESSEEA